MVALGLIAVFIVLPLVELYVIIQIGHEIGALPTIAILIADAILGSVLLRSQGRAAWRRFNEALQAARPPTREVLDGALVIFGAALLITPGFVTDILGLVLLVPPTRALVRRGVMPWLLRRTIVGVTARWQGPPGRQRNGDGRRPAARPYDVEGTAVDIDQPPLAR